jgi:hypothetical protein
MKTYIGSRGIASLILILGTKRKFVVNFTLWLLYPWQRIWVSSQNEAGLAAEPVWASFIRETCFALIGIGTWDRPARI